MDLFWDDRILNRPNPDSGRKPANIRRLTPTPGSCALVVVVAVEPI